MFRKEGKHRREVCEDEKDSVTKLNEINCFYVPTTYRTVYVHISI